MGPRKLVSTVVVIICCVALPQRAAAQCTSPPRAIVENATCTVGQDCEVAILLEPGAETVSAVEGQLTSTASLSCTECTTGDAAANGSCTLNPSTCQFFEGDLAPPIGPIGPGEVAILTLTCAQVGSFTTALEDVTMGAPGGDPIADPCGAGGTLDCVECQMDADCPDDGTFCNGPEVCSAGSCVSAGDPCTSGGECANVCDEAGSTCNLPADTPCSSDGNVCTDDVCAGDGSCVGVPNTDPCNDGLFCNGADTCNGGACSSHAGDPCAGADGDSDCSESCNESADDCTAADPNGSACTDGDLCTESDMCTSGTCGGATVDCSSLDDPCNVGECNASTGECEAQQLGNGTPCDDDLFCNGDDACQGGICEHSGNPCEDFGCREATDTCDDCIAPADCEDGNVCTDDVCTGGVCANPPNGEACDDGLFCNGEDTCGGGACSLHAGDPCPGADGDEDCAESCDEAADSCSANDPGGSACDDGLFCNGADVCSSGACSFHGGDPCTGPDGDADCAESCDEDADACAAADPDDSICDDTLVCTTDDRCSAGACVGAAVDCDDTLFCNGVESCDPSLGCQPGDTPDCSSLDGACTQGTCDEEDEGCVATPANDDDPCDDSDACTVDDRCSVGECAGGPLCDAGCEACNDGACVTLCGHPVSDPLGPYLASDALFILRTTVELEVCELCVCDVTNDGSILASDALRSARNAVGLDTTPPSCPVAALRTNRSTMPSASTTTTSSTLPPSATVRTSPSSACEPDSPVDSARSAFTQACNR